MRTLRRRPSKLHEGRGALPRVRALPLGVVALLLAGCLGGEPDPRAGLVPYPRLGDVAVYEVRGAILDLARWENGIPLPGPSQLRLTLSASPDALDGARAVHPAFKLTTELGVGGGFVLHSERYVSPRHQAVVQAYYPLSQDQSVVAFDERGFPWLWGASALIGEELREGARVPFALPDNLGRGQTMVFEWVVRGEEDGLLRVELEGEGANATLWMAPASPWPVRATMRLGNELAPHARVQSAEPVEMEARLVSLARGGDPVPPRDRGATFAPDVSVVRTAWDGEKPPDGDAAALRYPLSEAVAEAKLLDKPLQDWLDAADAPILYRGTFQEEPAEVEGALSAHWLLQWVDRSNSYYEVQIARLYAPPLPIAAPVGLPGVPRVESSGPAKPPADSNHGWFDPTLAPDTLVPLSEGIRIVRDVFGATEVQVFLRSFTDPPGYSYFLDGGFEEGGVGRYTVVYHPSTGFLEQSTGPVRPRLA